MKPRGNRIVILMAEDDPDDRMLAEDALETAHLANDLFFVENGEELMDYLKCRGKFPDRKDCPVPGLILLDLNMPRKDGREALKEIKEDDFLRRIPVVVLTTSKTEEDILRSYDLGVSGYVTKPVTFDRLVQVVQTMGSYWFEVVELPPGINGG